MISRSVDAPSIPDWQVRLRESVTRVAELRRLLSLPPDPEGESLDRRSGFALRVPREFVARMRPGDPTDPLLLQVLPRREELREVAGYTAEPLGEGDCAPTPGLLHKYEGRALVLAAGTCAVNCRYCFRREFPYADRHPWADGGEGVVRYLAADPSIREVILSGGDPLMASDERLADLVQRLEEISHLTTLRIHTRVPVVLPQRVDDAFVGWLGATRLKTVVVLHTNHGHEIDESVRRATNSLREAGAILLNQAVLLAGVNDSVSAQVELSEALFAAGVLPYYLHLLDRVRGAAHFEVDEPTARRILTGVRERLPGYLVPRLVREVPGEASKLPIL